MKLWKKMLIGLVLGVLTGILIGEHAHYLKPIGSLFMGLLNMLVVLLVFSSITVGVSSISDIKKLGRVGLKTLGLYALTTGIAIVLGLICARIINPGIGISLAQEAAPVSLEKAPDFVNMFLSLIPQNPIGSLANGHILQVIVFSFFFGLGITMAGEKGKPVAKAMQSLSEVMFSLTSIVMRFAPFGVFAMMAWVAGTFGVAILLPLLKLLLAVYGASIVHLVLIFGGLLLFGVKVRPGPFFRGMSDAIALAASTTSSSASLPATIHCCQENLGVSKNIANFLLPIGATVNMNGTAIFQGIAAVFVAQAYGIELGWISMLIIVVTATLSAVGTAGVPGSGLITLSIVLSSVGLPLEGIAIIAGIDRLRDIACTVMNVLGDAVVAVYVAKTEGELDVEKYNSGKYISYEHGLAAQEEVN